MDPLLRQLLLVLALVVLNAVFAGSEIALISLREGQIERLERSSRSGRALARLAREPNRFLSTIQIGITLAGFLASATAAVSLAQPLIEPLGFLGDAARPAAIFLVTAILTFVTLVVGELAPKRLAMQRSEQWALLVARPLGFLARLATPAVWVLGRSTDGVVRLFGGDPTRDREDVTEEEIHDLVTGSDVYVGFQRQVIAGSLEVADRTLRQVVTPTPEIIGIPGHVSPSEALRRLADAGHSRAPVYTERMDDAEGYVSALSLVDVEGTAADHAEPAVLLPETVTVLDALRRLQTEHRQMALVVSEHGSLEGLVTVEDLVEEIVGEIYDEHDRDVQEVVHHDDGSMEVAGRFPLHDLVDIGVRVPHSQETTLAGLVAERLGRLPEQGDRLRLADHELEVLAMGHRTVDRAVLRPRDADDHDDEDAAEDGAGNPADD